MNAITVNKRKKKAQKKHNKHALENQQAQSIKDIEYS
jgi:hypothetical protein